MNVTQYINITALRYFPEKSIRLILILYLAFFANGASARSKSDDGLHLELPTNGNLRIENLRGGVIAQVWNEDYLSVSAIFDSGKQSRSPAVVQRTDSLLSVRVARGPAGGPRINLELRIPARAHAAIITAEGAIEVRGLPAALLAQTISGEIRVELPDSAGTNLVAESKTGIVSSSLSSALVNQASRPQLQARLGNGSKGVRLYS